MASMKLRVRAAGGGPTSKVQVPLLCTLQGLKDALGPLIALPPASFSLSLNKKDEIQGPGSALLSSFGVTSGDLLFYIAHSGRSSPIPLTGNPPSSQLAGNPTPSESRVARASAPSIGSLEGTPSASSGAGGRAASASSSRRELCAAAAARRATVTHAPDQQREIGPVGSILTMPQEQTAAGEGSETTTPSPTGNVTPSSLIAPMVVEADETAPIEGTPMGTAGHRLVSVPDLLQRVLNAEFENIRQPAMLLVLAVHSVMLETGFLRIESRNTGTHNSPGRNTEPPRTVDGYGLPPQWTAAGLVNLSYTLPELTTRVATAGETGHEALLRCQIVGNAVVVYGAVTGGSVHRVSLSATKFLHENVKLGEVGAAGASSSGGGGAVEVGNEAVMDDVEPAVESKVAGAGVIMGESIFRDVFKLWKEVKDSLSLPLLSFMCEATGLPPPPSLLRLPTELKIKVLDSLPSVALANLACTCSEFRFLASNEELWEQKYREEFGASGRRAPGGRGWKSAFVRDFEQRRRREEERRQAERRYLAEVFPPRVTLRPPSLFPPFDIFPGLGSDSSRFNLARGVRLRRVPSGGGAFPNLGLGTLYGDLDGVGWSGLGRLDGDHLDINGGGGSL